MRPYSLSSKLDGAQWLRPRLGRFTLGTGGWVGPRAGVEGCGRFRTHRDSIPGPSSP